MTNETKDQAKTAWSGHVDNYHDSCVDIAKVEPHRRKIGEDPCRRRSESRDGARIHEPRRSVLDVVHALDARDMRMTAANEIPIAGARHRIAVLGIVNDEDAPSGQIETRVGAVIRQLSVAFACSAVERYRVAQVVAVNHVHRQADAERATQRLRADDVAAMDDGRCAFRRALSHRARKRVGTIVAVGNDANFHPFMITPAPRRRTSTPLMDPSAISTGAGARSALALTMITR